MDRYRQQLSHTTVFFRNRPQLEELAGAVLPVVWNDHPANLRILACGGSIGCEAYSLLVALREYSPDSLKAGGSVLSIDLTETVAAHGREAWFPAKTFAPLFGMEGGMPETIRARWFTAQADGAFWTPREELRAQVEFRMHDLLEEPLPERFDLVVCQNVLTHLQPASATTLLGRLLDRAKARAVCVCSGVDLDLKTQIAEAGFRPWTGRLDEIHNAFASHRMHYRENRGRHYFELEDIDRSRPDWAVRYSTLFYRCPADEANV